MKGLNSDEITLPITFSGGVWKLENDNLVFTGKTSFFVDEMEEG